MRKNDFGNYGVVYNEAFENVLPTLQAKSVDCVIIDPPNLISDDTSFSTSKENEMALFATFDFDFLASEFARITKKQSTINVFGHSNFQSFIYFAFSKQKLKHVTDLIWVKNNSVNFMHAKNKPLSMHELITCYKKEKLNYNWEEAKDYGYSNYSKKRIKDTGTLYSEIKRTDTNCEDGSRFMKTVIYANNKNTISIEERTEHPTQKPLSLFDKLVSAFSFKDQTVLDCFLGSGTTALACIKNKRYFIGIEKDPKYFDIACQRIEKEIIKEKSKLF